MTGFVSLASLSLTPAIFTQLQQLVQAIGQQLDGSVVLTHEDPVVGGVPSFAQTSQRHRFSLVWSERFKALVAQPWPAPNSTLQSSLAIEVTDENEAAALPTQLCFDPAVIRQHLWEWLTPEQHEPLTTTIWAETEPQPNDGELQAQFTAELITLLTSSQHAAPLVCQPLEVALQRRLAEERLLSQVTAQIRQSLDLDSILNTAIEAIRNYLGVDRVVIYQVLSLPRLRKPRRLQEIRAMKPESYRVYESCQDLSLPSVTDAAIYPQMLHRLVDWEQFQRGQGVAVADVSTTSAELPRLQQAMQRLQVQSRFTVPILVQNQVWGLLTLHQCHRIRPWQQADQD
ncbi:MAG: GAF domain-containing protein, partial [Cyanobacteria bacterium P01_H01_bin.121]